MSSVNQCRVRTLVRVKLGKAGEDAVRICACVDFASAWRRWMFWWMWMKLSESGSLFSYCYFHFLLCASDIVIALRTTMQGKSERGIVR